MQQMCAPLHIIPPLQFLLLCPHRPALITSLDNTKTSKGSHLLIRVPAPQPCTEGPHCASDPVNSMIPKCSSNICLLLLERILCLIFPVTTFLKYSRCPLLQEALLNLFN